MQKYNKFLIVNWENDLLSQENNVDNSQFHTRV